MLGGAGMGLGASDVLMSMGERSVEAALLQQQQGEDSAQPATGAGDAPVAGGFSDDTLTAAHWATRLSRVRRVLFSLEAGAVPLSHAEPDHKEAGGSAGPALLTRNSSSDSSVEKEGFLWLSRGLEGSGFDGLQRARWKKYFISLGDDGMVLRAEPAKEKRRSPAPPGADEEEPVLPKVQKSSSKRFSVKEAVRRATAPLRRATLLPVTVTHQRIQLAFAYRVAHPAANFVRRGLGLGRLLAGDTVPGHLIHLFCFMSHGEHDGTVLLARGTNPADTQSWMNAFDRHLHGRFDDKLYQEKGRMLKEMRVVHEKMIHWEIEKQLLLIRRLEHSGLVEAAYVSSLPSVRCKGILEYEEHFDKPPPSSAKKLKKWQARSRAPTQLMQQAPAGLPSVKPAGYDWKPYLTVLAGSMLLLYRDEHDTMPTRTISLAYASVSCRPHRLRANDYSFHVETPLLLHTFRCHSEAALCVWVRALCKSYGELCSRAGGSGLSLGTHLAPALAESPAEEKSPPGDARGDKEDAFVPSVRKLFHAIVRARKGPLSAPDLLSQNLLPYFEEKENGVHVRFRNMYLFWKEAEGYLRAARWERHLLGADIVARFLRPGCVCSFMEAKAPEVQDALSLLDSTPGRVHLGSHIFVALQRVVEKEFGVALLPALSTSVYGRILQGEDQNEHPFYITVCVHKADPENSYVVAVPRGRDSSSIVEVPDQHVSRRHGRFLWGADGGLLYEDVGSTYGSWVNGNEAIDHTPVQDGDVVRVGQSSLVVRATIPDACAFFVAGDEVDRRSNRKLSRMKTMMNGADEPDECCVLL